LNLAEVSSTSRIVGFSGKKKPHHQLVWRAGVGKSQKTQRLRLFAHVRVRPCQHYSLGATTGRCRQQEIHMGNDTDAVFVRQGESDAAEVVLQLGRDHPFSEHTIRNYILRIYEKLGVSNRVQLTLKCAHQFGTATLSAAPPLKLGQSA
jgi:hypothetical protein